MKKNQNFKDDVLMAPLLKSSGAFFVLKKG